MNAALVSKLPYEAKHPDTLAVYCSDGRFTEAIEKLVHDLGHARLDTLTIPGGPALLDLTSSGYAALETVRSATSFLIVGHAVKHVTLVTHEGCGYYRDRYRLDSAESMLRRQLADLRGAARWVRTTHAGVKVSAFHARPIDGHVSFEPLVDP